MHFPQKSERFTEKIEKLTFKAELTLMGQP